MFYTSLYKCILQNIKHVKVMFVWNIFKELYKTFFKERFTISFINNQEINLNLLLGLI